jgi:hypothetical protein
MDGVVVQLELNERFLGLHILFYSMMQSLLKVLVVVWLVVSGYFPEKHIAINLRFTDEQ